ncbi:MAG: histidine kinase N-terminal 7TM domain-containing protein [Anaerolineaceae bacterium]
MLIFIFPLIISTILGIVLSFIIFRNQSIPGTKPLLIMILGATIWSAGYALEIISPVFEVKIFWAKIQYFGITIAPLFWAIFTNQYTTSRNWLSYPKRYRFLLGFVPMLTTLLVWTNDLHNLIWRTIDLQPFGPYQMLAIHHGPLFWVNVIYGYGMMMFGSYQLIKSLINSLNLHRWQIIMALTASLIPWISNLIYLFDWNPIPHLDWTPFSFTLASLFFSLSLFRFRLINILPIARQSIFSGQKDSLIVLDALDLIVDLNPAAMQIVPAARKEIIGKPIGSIFPELSLPLAQAGFSNNFHMEISLGKEENQRFYDFRSSLLKGAHPRPIGRLVALHEITALKVEQNRLEIMQSQLEQKVKERTETLRVTIQQLQGELNQRVLAERRFEGVVESAPEAMLLVDHEGSILLVNAQAETLFGYTRSELLSHNIDMLIPGDRRQNHPALMSQFMRSPKIRQVSQDLNLSALRKDGSVFPVEISLGPLETGEGFSVACTVRDITLRKRAEEAQKLLLAEIQHANEIQQALTTRVQNIREIERRQIASDLHDRIGQKLTGINLSLQIIQNKLTDACDPNIRQRLAHSLILVEETTREVRDVMADLHPPMLDEYGLGATLRWYCTHFSQQTGIHISLNNESLLPRLPQNVETTFFRVVQESFTNTTKHAQASEIVVTIEKNNDEICLIIQDNGRGFNPDLLNPQTDQPHWGLMNLKQSAISIGGELEIQSNPGHGTKIKICITEGKV